MIDKKIIQLLASIVLLIGVVLTLRYATEVSNVKAGEFRYSIVEIKDHYYQGEVIGKIVMYRFKGKVYQNHCATQLCKGSKIGDKYYARIFLKDPNIFEMVNVRPSTADAPHDGWRTIPKSKF
jgi:hypothetical protein